MQKWKPSSVQATRSRSLEGGGVDFVIGGDRQGWPEVRLRYKAIID